MKKHSLTILILLYLVTTQSSAQQDKGVNPATEHIEAVQILINDREFENAIARVEAALKKNKNNPDLLLQRGLVLVKLNRLAEAKSHYRKIKRKLKTNAEPWNNLAMVYRLEGNYQQAVLEFKKTIKKFPKYVAAYENLGDTYIEMAQRQYVAGLEQQPDIPILISKSNLGNQFNQIAQSNTPAARRNNLARAENPGKPTVTETKLDPATEDKIFTLLSSWISAWSDRNIDLFLSHYSNEYVPQNSLALSEWLSGKSAALDQAKYIRIRLDDIEVSRIDAQHVTASFKQYYESDTADNTSIKTLTFRKYQSQWFIVEESSRITG